MEKESHHEFHISSNIHFFIDFNVFFKYFQHRRFLQDARDAEPEVLWIGDSLIQVTFYSWSRDKYFQELTPLLHWQGGGEMIWMLCTTQILGLSDLSDCNHFIFFLDQILINLHWELNLKCTSKKKKYISKTWLGL